MKIIAVLERPATSGGEFNQGLNTIMQMSKICKGRFEFEIFTDHAENIKFLEKLGFNCVCYEPPLPKKIPSPPEKIPSLLDRIIARANLLSRWKARQNRKKMISSLEENVGSTGNNIGWFEKKLIEHGADLVYFLTQSVGPEPLQQLNYITTVFDLCHRDTPEFPEVRIFGQFQGREFHCKNNLAQALLVITESENLANLVSQRYGIDRTRCLAMPMSPAPFLHDDHSVDKYMVLKKYDLEEGYFFYPAQFWSHKNHVRILEALVLLREAGNNFRVVFAGSDKGNQGHIENLVARYSLNDQVKFLGFVPAEHMRGLYEGCAAVVMPTYFGPTNLPPLEAWMIGKPLIYSAHLKEQAGDAAVYANPDSAKELAEAMKAGTDPETAIRLVEYGTLRLRQLEQQRKGSESELINRLLQFEARRRCWA
jgi:glycosyltransferase involved in cell wall biosynthesis